MCIRDREHGDHHGRHRLCPGGLSVRHGLGLDLRSGELIYTHGGIVESYTTNMQILPGQGVAIIVMFNACDYFVSNVIALQLSYISPTG